MTESLNLGGMQEHRRSAIDEFRSAASQSMMQASVVDVTRDRAFMLAKDADGIVVENLTPGNQGTDVTTSTIEVELNYF